ncbi:RNA transcription, translation and transport factor protein isoform X2 [Daktulosphaira vitifoliae]|uniref:RNA transcription, translation and transport factor protein isoform X2 n=1 Tax=Daktulosphaira vitifoliae TaxID=58002 RepID=UPI0021A9BCB0|nr:RNA transcription, translation and transport factor protein isoform X2 [Daktulosphaira vitifoliae]
MVQDFFLKNEKCLREIVVWLEINKLSLFKPKDCAELKKINSTTWESTFKKYCTLCSSPIKSTQLQEHLEWLLGFAIRKEYTKNKQDYESKTKEVLNSVTDVPMVVPSNNPIDNLDCNSQEFKEGVEKLADLLNISKHPNHLVTLEAIRNLVCKRLSDDCIKNPSSVLPKGEPFPLDLVKSFKNKSSNPAVEQALKVLRLVQVHKLRDLQTCINECIVSMQQITSNPKTDTKLGKVGY